MAAKRPGGGGLSNESDGDACRKIRIKPLKETNLGVAQALFDLSGKPC